MEGWCTCVWAHVFLHGKVRQAWNSETDTRPHIQCAVSIEAHIYSTGLTIGFKSMVRYESCFSNISTLNGTCMHHQFNMKCPGVCSGMHYIKRLLSLLINLSVTLINNWWIAWSIQCHIIVKNGLVSSKFQIDLKWFKRQKSSQQLHLRSCKRWMLDIFAW